MSSSSLLSFYPTYAILDEVLAIKNYKNMIVYLDLKNNLQTTYMEHAVINILESSKRGRFIDTSIFSSLLSFLAFHKIYALKKGIKIHFVIFYESGQSYYHTNIYKHYKVSRRIDELYGLDRSDRELFAQTLQANFKLTENAGNQLPGVTVIGMKNFEADFIPYYLTTRELVPMSDDIVHLVYSNDHDLWQCVKDNVYVYSKTPTSKKIIRPGQVMSLFLKQECSFADECLPLAMGINGDSGDDVPGIKGIGPKRIFSILSDVIGLVGDMNTLYERLENKIPIFNDTGKTFENKYLNKILNEKYSEEETNIERIQDNIRLVSFEMISRYLDSPPRTEGIDTRKYIEKVLNTNQKTKKEEIKKALENCGVMIENEALDYLYV